MKDLFNHFFVLLITFIGLILFSFVPLRKSLPETPFIINSASDQKVCSELGCLEVRNNDKINFNKDTFEIKSVIEEIENLYKLKQDLMNIKAVLTNNKLDKSCAIEIIPAYATFINYNELDRVINTSIKAPLECFSGEGDYNLKLTHDNNTIGDFMFKLEDVSFPYSAILSKQKMFVYHNLNQIIFIVLFVITIFSCIIENRLFKEKKQIKYHIMLVRYILLATVYLLSFSELTSGIRHFFIVGMILLSIMPWGGLPQVQAFIERKINTIILYLCESDFNENKDEQVK